MSVARSTCHQASQTSLVEKTIRRAQILCNELDIGVPVFRRRSPLLENRYEQTALLGANMPTKKSSRRNERMEQLRGIIAAEEISLENGAEARLDDEGKLIEDIATCGTCGKSWNDALITSRTPVPSARCPYEYIHDEIAELRKLERRAAA
jgi:hypothetical protein